MKTSKILIIAIVAMITGVSLTSCGGSKQVTTATRGVKIDKEECEEMALQNPMRASGIGSSQSERLAKNSAALDARNNLIAAINSILVGMIKNFDQEHQAGAGAGKQSDFVNQTGEEQKGLVDGVLSSRIICSNTYMQQDGNYTTYVCVEMNDGAIGALYNKLSQEKKISIQFEEKKFREEMEKELENYRNTR